MENNKFDMLLRRVRTLRAYMTDTEVAIRLVEEGAGTSEDLFLLLASARILDDSIETD